jgi:hypothetical protein
MSVEVTEAEKVNIHNLLVRGEAVDHYLHKKFTTFVFIKQINISRKDIVEKELSLYL